MLRIGGGLVTAGADSSGWHSAISGVTEAGLMPGGIGAEVLLSVWKHIKILLTDQNKNLFQSPCYKKLKYASTKSNANHVFSL